MASFQTNTKNGYYAILNITETYQNVSENYTDIYYSLDLYSTSYAFNGWTIGYDIYLDGVQIAYHTNSGNQTSMSKGGQKQVVTGTKRFYHNTDGTRSFSIYAKVFTDNMTYLPVLLEVSGTAYLTTIPRYATCNQSLNSKTLSSIKINWSSDSTIDYVWYSIDNGSSWVAVGSVNVSNGSYDITGLSANTSYNIKTRVRRKDSQLTTDSATLNISTYQIGEISSISNFNHGDNTNIVITNPSRIYIKFNNENCRYYDINTSCGSWN